MPARPAPPSDTSPGDPYRRRERRRTQDVRAALLASAARLFARHGFARTTTREIADDAKVAETAVYRHFGSKQELFVAAIVTPFERFSAHYVERWWPIVDAGADNATVLRGFMDDFYDALCDNKDAVVALLMSQGDPAASEAIAEGRRLFADLFASLTSLAEGQSRRSPGLTPVFTNDMTTRFIVGMLTLVTAFDTWFVPNDPTPSKEQIIDIMAGMVLPGLLADGHRGVAHRALEQTDSKSRRTDTTA
jgi:AcrR family transcriptional regulator